MFSCKGEEGNRGMGGEGGKGAAGGGKGVGGGGAGFWSKFMGGGETSPPEIGAHLWFHTEGPPHNGNLGQ